LVQNSPSGGLKSNEIERSPLAAFWFLKQIANESAEDEKAFIYFKVTHRFQFFHANNPFFSMPGKTRRHHLSEIRIDQA
jgi:hypothetical protein